MGLEPTNVDYFMGLSKKETCLRGRGRGRGRSAENVPKFYNIII